MIAARDLRPLLATLTLTALAACAAPPPLPAEPERSEAQTHTPSDPCPATGSDPIRCVQSLAATAHAQQPFTRGLYHYRVYDYDAAIVEETEALRLDPKSDQALLIRGLSYLHKERYALALADMDELLRLRPDFANGLLLRGRVREAAEDPSAIDDYDAYIEKQPNSPAGYLARGMVRFYLGQYALAEEDFVRAQQLHREWPFAVLWLHLAHDRMGTPDADEFTANAARVDLIAWPGPLISFYAGKITLADLRAGEGDRKTNVDRTQVCTNDFFVGEYQLQHQDRAAAIASFRAAMVSCATLYEERNAARAELARLTGKPK